MIENYSELAKLDFAEDTKNDDSIHEEKKNKKRRRNRQFALDQMHYLSEEDFRRMFRMSRSAFNSLLQTIEPYMHNTDELQGVRAYGSIISNTTKLAVTLRWLSGGSYIDICFAFGIGYSTFFAVNGVVWPTIHAIDTALNISFPFDDDTELKRIAEDFSLYSKNTLKHCVLAIDGWVCVTRCPTKQEVTNQLAYRNRHGCWGIVILAGCEANTKFRMFSCVSSGSTHDAVAWQFSMMKSYIDEGGRSSIAVLFRRR